MNIHFRSQSQRNEAASVGVFFLIGALAAQAATATWNGGGADNALTNTANWVGGAAPNASGDDVIFAGTVNLSPTNNTAGDYYSFNSLTFKNGPFTLSGSRFHLSGTLNNLTAGPQTNNCDIALQTSISITNTANGTLVLNGVISGDNVGIANVLPPSGGGNGTLVLTANNTFTAPFVMSIGTVVVPAIGNSGSAGPLGAAPAGVGANAPIQTVGTSTSYKKTLQYVGSGETNDRSIFVGGLNTGANNAFVLNASGTGPLVLNGATNVLVKVVQSTGNAQFILAGTSTADNTLAGDVRESNGNALGMLKTGSGTWLLQGAKNFRGGVLVTGGTLKFDSLAPMGTACALGSASKLYVVGGDTTPVNYAICLTNGGVLQYVGTTVSVSDRTIGVSGNGTVSDGAAGGSLALSGGVVNITGDMKTLTLDGSGNSAISGVINDTFGTLALAKKGMGTWTLANPNNYYQSLAVNSGTLVIATGSTASGGITIADGAALGVDVSASGQVSVPSTLTWGAGTGAALNFNSLNSLSTAAMNVSSLVLNGANQINISGGTFVSGNTYPLIHFSSISGSGSISLGDKPANLNAIIVTNAGNSEIDLVVESYYPDVWAAGNGNWDDSSLNWLAGTTPISYGDGDNVVFDDSPSGSGPFLVSIASTSVSPGSVTMNNNSKDYTIAGNIAGSGSLTVNGTGKLSLASVNTYTGGTFINAGTLQLGDGTNVGTAGTGALVNNGTLVAGCGTNNASTSANISGAGSFKKEGTGTFTLSGNNAYSGNTIIDAGGLQIVSGAGIGTGLVTNNGSLLFNFTTNDSLTNSISGPGNLLSLGSAKVSISGNNTYSGQTTVGAGVLVVSNPNGLGNTAGIVVSNGATLGLDSGITVTGKHVSIAGIGNNLGALQSYAGDSVWAGGVTLAAAGTRLGVGTGANSLTVSGVIDSGGILFTNGAAMNIRCQSSSQTVVLSASNTYLGDTVINAGILQLAGGDNRLPVATTVFLGIGSGGGQPGFLDLNGFNQEISGAQMNSTAAGALTSALMNSSATASTLTVNSVTNTEFAGVVGGNLSLVKTGAALFAIDGVNTYSGATLIAGGTLLINGSTDPSSAVSVAGGAMLGGSGTIGGNVTLDSGALVTNNQGAPLTINGSLVMNDNKIYVSTASPLTPGDYTLITYNTAGSAGSFNATPVITGAGLDVGTQATVLTGSGTVVLHVVSSTPSSPAGFPANALAVSSGTASLSVTGAIGTPFTLWASTNLALTPVGSTWTKLTNGTVTVSPFIITDPGAGTNRQRFYILSNP